MKKLFILLFAFLFTIDVFACTSAIFTGKVTKDGRPLMWKNRDTGELNNRIERFKGPRYLFLALVNSPVEGGEAWAGSNEAGFCIMNTASYNLAIKEDSAGEDGEGELMFKALGICRTLADFEKFLDTLARPMPIEANFGVIDAEGGAAYYEVNSRSWSKTDVNDPHIAPQGYIVYTNYSYTGRNNEGMGYVRYTTADNIIKTAVGRNTKITPQWIMDNLSKSYYHSLLDVDLCKSDITAQTGGWFIDQDFIPRKSTSAVAIFQSVLPGEDPSNTIFWCAIGYPPISLPVPMIIKYSALLPAVMVKNAESSNCKACDLALELKKNIFPVKRGNGGKYFLFSKVYNPSGTGYMQQLQPSENKIFALSEALTEKLRSGKLTKKEVEEFNKQMDTILTNAYSSIK